MHVADGARPKVTNLIASFAFWQCCLLCWNSLSQKTKVLLRCQKSESQLQAVTGPQLPPTDTELRV